MSFFFFFSSRRRHTRLTCDWSSDVCSSDLGQVLQFGARDYGMRIWLDPGKMSRLGVTTGDISSAINEQNVVAPAGIVGAEPAPPGQQMTYTVTVHGRLRSVQEFENVVLKAGPNGSIVRLRDV